MIALKLAFVLLLATVIAWQSALSIDSAPKNFPGLSNVVAFHDGFYSGSAPAGDAGFDSLSSLGIKTILSVDGAMPDVELADKYGMRYVHLPIGYDGFDDEIGRAHV